MLSLHTFFYERREWFIMLNFKIQKQAKENVMKKKTQRLLAILCLFALALGLSACGKGGSRWRCSVQ